MKLLTVSLCLCAVMALTVASDEPPTTPPPPTLPIFPTKATTRFGSYPKCPDRSWRKFQIRCLLYVPKKMTWSEAQSSCPRSGLAAALDDSFSEDIVTVLREAGHTSGQVWVGGCSTGADSWDWSTYSYRYRQQDLTCIQAPSGGKPFGCLNSTLCEPELPSICSWTLM